MTLVVDQAAQTITWANPANITYGTLLSSTELNATVAGSSTIGASAPGALTYSPVAGTLLNAGSQTLTVNAAATSNYLAATKSVTLVVDKALQTITWANPANITYGTLLSSTELNATVAGSSTTGATAPGALTYSPAAGGLLNAGSQTLNVTAAATSNYLAATEAVTLVVDQAVQTITWVDPANIIYGTLLSSTELNATVAGSSTTGASAPGALTYSPAAGTLLNTGIQTLTVNAAATGNYLAATKSVTLVVDQAVQTITWANPANITYGTLLSATELNATVAGSSTAGASAPGALTYSPTAGTLLNAGSQTLTVTAAATSNYLAATQSVTLVVDKALQTITWANPANADYGNLISLTQLNATVVGVSTPGATDPGALVYSPVLGTLLDAGNNILTVTALGTANYLQATAQVDWFIDKIDQIITWARPQAITYGTVLSATQLNATVDGSSTPGASAPGLLTYSPTAGTLLNAGIQVLNVTAAATNNYNAASASVNQTVNQAVQTITWVTPANIVYGTLLSSTQLNAVVAGSSTPGASSPGALSYTPPAGTLLNAGTQTLQVTAAATLNYLQATGQVNLIVEKANQAITWNTPAPITYGTRLSGTQLNASVAGVSGGTPAGALSYTPPANTLLNAGTNRLTVTAAATANYNAASQGVDLVVNKAAQSIAWVTPAAITYGTLLSGTQLNAVASGVSGGSAAGALSYTPPAGTLLDAGSQTLSVTAAATSNYLVAVNTVTLLVNKAAQTITWANPANILQGTPLSSTQLNATVTGSSTAGATPPGALTYTPGTGTVLPDGPNTLTVNAAATSNYLQAQRSVTLVVDEAPVFTSANATTMVAGTLGSFSLTTTGYPARTYSVTGALPAGVTLAPSTGVLSGTAAPLTGGIYAVVMGATNGVLPNASQNFTLTVNEAPAFTSAASAIFLEGIANTFTVTASGFPAPRFAITSGTLPQGLSFNTTTGVVSGTAALGILGTYPVVVTASNGIAPIAVQNLSIHVYRNVPVATGAVLTTPFNLGSGSYVVSLGNGSVLIHNPSGVEQQFAPFPGFTGTLSTSLVDRNGDGTADSILVAVATGGSPAVLVVDSATGRVAYNFYAFAPGFFGGVSVAGGVTTYQGKVTTVVLGGAGPGAEPSISAFDAVTGQARGAFYAFDPHYTGGVRVAMTGPDSTGASLIIGSPAINSNIVLFSLDQPNVALASFYAFMPPDLYRGTWVAGGDLDGDGISEVVVGAGPGTNGKAEVSVFNLAGRQLANFLAFSQGFTGGVSVAVSDYNSDGKGDIFCSSGAGARATFNVFSYPDLALMDAVFLPTSSLLGTFVANNPSA
ncbi:MAG: VCBS repeat-containing protein [Planctomycetota bacterium]|nr:VCBS repeat-containing protein [Planctomycetota bacterium]